MTVDPGAFEDPRGFLRRHNLRPKDSFGQCFLIASPVAENIVNALAPEEGETIIEIGTGCGTLAKMVAPRAKQVIAIERDRELVAALQSEGLPSNITLLEQDAGAFDYGAVASQGPTSIVGNLPYQITGKLLRAILAPPIKWRTAVVMVQREVAQRMTATPGSDHWGVLGVFTRAACETKKVCDASPRCFHPAPRIVSTVVRLTPRAVPLAEETPEFQRVVHAVFAQRRKTVQNGLASIPDVGRDRAAELCAAAGVDPMKRAEQLSIEQLAAMATALRK